MGRIEQITEFIKTNPDDPFLQHALALEHIKLGQEEKPRQLFEQLLAAKPDYVGSYYHLAKLLERTGQVAEAITWYEKGMATAKAAGDHHALGELRAAYEDLTD